MLKAKLAKLKRELITPASGGGGKQDGFDVAKTGDARIGYMSVRCCCVARSLSSRMINYENLKNLVMKTRLMSAERDRVETGES